MKQATKMYTVIWTDEARDFYGIQKGDTGIVPLDDGHGIEFNASNSNIGRPKLRCADIYPFFNTRKEADAYREGNDDWSVIQVLIQLA